MLVEDGLSVQEFVREALDDAGYDGTISPTAEEALKLLESGVVKYRALVAYVHLEGATNGWELARRVIEIDPAFPVVYMTGATPSNRPPKGVPNSILLQKPIAPAQLVRRFAALERERHRCASSAAGSGD